MPRYAVLSPVTTSLVISCFMIGIAISAGIAYPIPSTLVSEYFTELIPTTSPFPFKSAPPLLPGFMAASVCSSSFVIVLPSVSLVTVTSRSSALITPVVTDCPYPRALPIAMAIWPACNADEFPNMAVRIAFLVSSSISDRATLTTAKSLLASVPLTFAWTDLPSENSTVSVIAPSITWLFVAI